MYSNVIVGSDPEFFLEKDGEPISAEGLIGGSKACPLILKVKRGHFYGVQEDNVAVEFNVPPSDNPDEFYSDFKYIWDEVSRGLPSSTTISNKSSHYFTDGELDTPQARTFGCDPDYDVWTSKMNESSCPSSNLRTAGGHIHIGYNKPDVLRSSILVKALDLFVGIPLVFLDSDKERQKMYGKAGSFRYKKYGIEYRVPSNWWLGTKDRVVWMFDAIFRCIDFLNKGNYFDEEITAKKCINDLDMRLAQETLERYSLTELVFETVK